MEAARRFYGPPPPSEDLAASLWGATPEDVCPPVALWPDNAKVVAVFTDCSTQWRTGFGGAYGIDYGVLEWLFKMHGIENAQRAFKDIKLMERVALDEMARQNPA
ncbi:hypothetical protein HK578_016 [Escherichia phage HK578]|uniref:Uncharacterized protein n=3 Tax=Dhillonvirus TaxID=1623289 RepID=K7P6Y9_9CAUD|nr:hypothetical protein F843_gp16 [Escherichia phage HK578]AFH20521.1 hypothetical protein HK578_016 [Escherichia phage HK578]